MAKTSKRKTKTATARRATRKTAGTKTAKKTAKKSSSAKTSKTASKKKSANGSLKVGDKVSWGTSQGGTSGRVVKKQTSPTQIKTHKVAASKDDPQYIVESSKSGKRAAHKAAELKPAS